MNDFASWLEKLWAVDKNLWQMRHSVLHSPIAEMLKSQSDDDSLWSLWHQHWQRVIDYGEMLTKQSLTMAQAINDWMIFADRDYTKLLKTRLFQQSVKRALTELWQKPLYMTQPLTAPYQHQARQRLWHEQQASLYGYNSDNKEPLLLLISPLQRAAIYDLNSEYSLVKRLMNYFSVYLLDWGETEVKAQSIDDFLTLITEAMQTIYTSEHRPVNLLAQGLGGTLALAYASYAPPALKTLITLGAPFNFKKLNRIHPLLRCLPDQQWPEMIPGNYLNLFFTALEPYHNTLGQVWQQMQRKDPWVLSYWRQDRPRIASQFVQQLMTDLLQDNLLYKNEWQVAGQSIDVTKINCPQLNLVYGGESLIRLSSQLTLAVTKRFRGTAVDHIVHGEKLVRSVCDFLIQNSGK
jgi:pimeloyl-ACP methyl ester carboxylesterase